MKNNIFDKLKQILPGIQENVLLKDYTTYKIGGLAEYFFIAKTKDELIKAVKATKKLKLPLFILGAGSNVLVSDKGFKGLVIKIQMSDFNVKSDKIYTEAGLMLSKLVAICQDNSLSGLEWAAGIPGTVGGAIFGHAQAFGDKMSDSIESVEAFDIKTLKVKNFNNKQCKFSLKNSIFKRNKNLIILSAILQSKKIEKEKIQKKILQYLDYRKNNHPIVLPSAGSMFVNPEITIKNKKLLDKFSELKEFNKNKVIYSAYLIEKAGLKGKTIGKAQISEKHANFIVNLGQAKAKDVLRLIALAKKKVKKTFGIDLETEVQFIGF